MVQILTKYKIRILSLLVILLVVGTSFIVFLRGNSEKLRAQNEEYLISEFGFSKEEILGLSDFEHSLSPAHTQIRDATFATTLQLKHQNEIIPEFNSVKYSSSPATGKLASFDFQIDADADAPVISYDHAKYRREGYHTNFYFEIDNTPDFNSPMLWRYPNLMPMYAVGRDKKNKLKNVFNPSDVTLYLHRASTRRMFNIGKITFPFSPNVMLAKFGKDRRKINIDNLEAISLLLTENMSASERQSSVFNFVKLNQVWGSDTRWRGPLESFSAKVVGCGHMNTVAGLLLELAGDRYRLVGGFDPYVRPTRPGGGHSAIEIYSKELGGWSYLDSYLDFHYPGVSISQFNQNPIGKVLVNSYEVNGEPYDLTLANLFRFRKYGDAISRRRRMAMTHMRGNEVNYGLDWPTAIRDFDNEQYLNEETTIYVRGRYAYSGCPVAFLEDSNKAKNCNTDEVVLSNWIVRKFAVKRRILNKLN